MARAQRRGVPSGSAGFSCFPAPPEKITLPFAIGFYLQGNIGHRGVASPSLRLRCIDVLLPLCSTPSLSGCLCFYRFYRATVADLLHDKITDWQTSPVNLRCEDFHFTLLLCTHSMTAVNSPLLLLFPFFFPFFLYNINQNTDTLESWSYRISFPQNIECIQ